MALMFIKYLLGIMILLSIIPITLIFIESFIEEKDYDDDNNNDNWWKIISFDCYCILFFVGIDYKFKIQINGKPN